jgi:hypothetical protein
MGSGNVVAVARVARHPPVDALSVEGTANRNPDTDHCDALLGRGEENNPHSGFDEVRTRQPGDLATP